MSTMLEHATIPAQAGAWTAVCRVDDLLPERGAAALVDGLQVALFRLADGTVLAVGNRDPFSGSNVMSRGIVGTRGDRAVVQSPMHKQVFDLVTGICLESAENRLPTYPVRVSDGVIEIALAPQAVQSPGS